MNKILDSGNTCVTLCIFNKNDNSAFLSQAVYLSVIKTVSWVTGKSGRLVPNPAEVMVPKNGFDRLIIQLEREVDPVTPKQREGFVFWQNVQILKRRSDDEIPYWMFIFEFLTIIIQHSCYISAISLCYETRLESGFRLLNCCFR